MIEVTSKNVTVKVVADSIWNGKRLTTLECDYPRYVHAHLMTHRMLSKNAQSSRAVPTKTWIKQLYSNPVYPNFNRNQKGMSGGDNLTGIRLFLAVSVWNTAKFFAVIFSRLLHKLDVHKQVANRILEPFQKIRVVISATEWDNFFNLRLHEDAQPEIRELAFCINDALNRSVPKETTTHLPYFDKKDKDVIYDSDLIYSVGRCAQVSYRKDELDIEHAKEIFKQLVCNEPRHESPLEHIAFADDVGSGNFRGWKQLRHNEEEIIRLKEFVK